MTGLVFGGSFRFDFETPAHPANDRLIIADNATAPLANALWAVAMRNSDTSGGPKPPASAPSWFAAAPSAEGLFGSPETFAPPGTSRQLRDGQPRRTFILLSGHTITDSSRNEALQLAARRRLTGVVGITSITRLSRRSRKGVLGRDLAMFARRVAAYGWRTRMIDGHDFAQILAAFREATAEISQPVMIVARTLISDDLSFLDVQRHERVLNADSWAQALARLTPAGQEVPTPLTPPADSSFLIQLPT